MIAESTPFGLGDAEPLARPSASESLKENPHVDPRGVEFSGDDQGEVVRPCTALRRRPELETG